jgi:hypothetical protein
MSHLHHAYVALTVSKAVCASTKHGTGIYQGFITMMMEAVYTSETSAYFNETTQHYIPEGFHLHTHHHKNLKFDYSFFSWLLINMKSAGQLHDITDH